MNCCAKQSQEPHHTTNVELTFNISMLRALQTFSTLRWTQQPQYRPLPSHTERKFVQTPNGPLELLACEPRQPSENGMCPAMFFVHGGYGCASVWLEWMTYLYEQDYPGRLYAYSIRSHGAGHAVSYLHMVFNTSLGDIRYCRGCCRVCQPRARVERRP